jgi:hypothetical protein
MNRLEGFIVTLDYVLNTKRKKHITGGILTSMSLLFAGLAVTVLSLKTDNKEDDDEQYIE